MKQLLILSGKGGTGKTTIASAFIELYQAKLFADCDVDAPNLHLIMSMVSEPIETPFYGLSKFRIDPNRCIHCDECRLLCRFGAITQNTHLIIDPLACEGCGLCEAICPAGAIESFASISGDRMLYIEKDRRFSTAKLRMGNGNSGLLVTEVKNQLQDNLVDTPLAIIDGSPGIGCPVIASMSGVDMVLIVTEPSLSGLSDLKRIVKTAAVFETKTAVCINKADLADSLSEKIRSYCKANQISFVGSIPYDPMIVQALNHHQSVLAKDSTAARAIKTVFSSTLKLLMT
ncbi:MAG: ATP-binding protein [Candidatus Izemoplasmatales bacterium]|nr:ATP-binding protein [Candidatus Izemoplasmatales bacterium]MDD4354555.1 ATP-binding protein [Candidatus Izemoplasmatales bacterium]MDD5601613.1 ATP-binding protein [Candidatus Izemoplasmatales bacterium]MDY0372736.1 ATP-binding protein [Candidatus Izemoplasmatales bacterium]